MRRYGTPSHGGEHGLASQRYRPVKYLITRFKGQKIALKELAPFIRDGVHLRTGRPFERFAGMRSREVLANWLMCEVLNAEAGRERFRFTSDPLGGDGIIEDTQEKVAMPTEHVMVPPAREGERADIQALILEQIALKQAKGRAAYAAGKMLTVFLEAGNREEWIPNRVARALPENDFDGVWVVGLHGIEGGDYLS